MSRSRFEKFKQVLRQRQADMTVLTDQVHKAQNISAILRSADAVGIPEIHMVKPERGHLVYHNTAGGSGRFTGRVIHNSIEQGMQHLRAQGFQLYAAHASERAKHYRNLDYTRPFALVMGAEKHGLSDYAREHADEHLMIPMIGMVESYNVSVAAGIVLQEAMHQRQQAGLYDRETPEDEQFQRTLFRWAQPAMANYCDRHQLPYPELDEDGDLIPPDDPAYRIPTLR
ncbi:tRNA (guanosine(18)-2'-O)-methyltransferase TrmH [Marinimicrobium sp. ABcell2]|uniref:tRNA (guanosine(18)-2'-O)-methyltransferase TrmH n=1 Tax=Marinimicrobium sp. ABcell2 TaxID=3069751 RepID=UPI0027B87178|nr:tRNA (guanosine(18)-2'-O)-methyltransferase TrmH [Marinimicrobium sp. ABcell2]MDQ2076007.1 tRNA (guanosine(18)-2'-O)-methyltransferase TrmH [Marinimicrobium sp. ABcell2]